PTSASSAGRAGSYEPRHVGRSCPPERAGSFVLKERPRRPQPFGVRDSFMETLLAAATTNVAQSSCVLSARYAGAEMLMEATLYPCGPMMGAATQRMSSSC